MEEKIEDGKYLKVEKFKRETIVIYIALGLGIICIISCLLKTWFGEVVEYDWFILGMGVVLCGLSLFRKFEVSESGVKAEIALLAYDKLVSKLVEDVKGKS